jgi:hypothetical protein
MKKHKVAYVDEERSAINTFQRQVHETLDVLEFIPKPDLDEFVQELLNSEAEAFVVDFRLNVGRIDVEGPITYNGSELVEKILAVRKGFPCFVLTGYDEDAVQQTTDVNYVYSKDILEPGKQPGNITLAEKIRVQIEHYQANLKKQNERFEALLHKSETQGLTEAEENELLKLDSFLESVLDDRESLAPEKKNEIAVGKIEELINSTQELLNVLRNEGS